LICRRCLIILLLHFFICNLVLSAENPEGRETQKYPIDVKFAVGASLTSGNTSTRTATIDCELDKKYSRFRVRINGKGAYGEASYADGPWIKSTNNWRIISRVEWFTTSQLHSFLFAECAIKSNHYRGNWLGNSVQGVDGIILFSQNNKVDLGPLLGIDFAGDILILDNAQKPEKILWGIKT
jgi:hypothetical protein